MTTTTRSHALPLETRAVVRDFFDRYREHDVDGMVDLCR